MKASWSLIALIFLAYELPLVIAKDFKSIYDLNSTDDFKISTAKISYYNKESMEMVDTTFPRLLNQKHRFGIKNVTISGTLWYADSSLDFVQNCVNNTLSQYFKNETQQKEFNNYFWLMSSKLYIQQVYSKVGSNQSIPREPFFITNGELFFDRMDARIPYDTDYFILHVPNNDVSIFIYSVLVLPNSIGSITKRRKSSISSQIFKINRIDYKWDSEIYRRFVMAYKVWASNNL